VSVPEVVLNRLTYAKQEPSYVEARPNHYSKHISSPIAQRPNYANNDRENVKSRAHQSPALARNVMKSFKYGSSSNVLINLAQELTGLGKINFAIGFLRKGGKALRE
jgi:hypothetical protein